MQNFFINTALLLYYCIAVLIVLIYKRNYKKFFIISLVPPFLLLILSLSILTYNKFTPIPLKILLLYTLYSYLSLIGIYIISIKPIKLSFIENLPLVCLILLDSLKLIIKFLTEVINGNKHAYLEINYQISMFKSFALFVILSIIWHGIKSVYKITKQKFAK